MVNLPLVREMWIVNAFAHLLTLQVRVAISNRNSATYIVRSTQFNSVYDICNGRPHEIIIRFKSTQLEVIVDGKMDTTSFSGTPVITTNSPLYIGGVPSKFIFVSKLLDISIVKDRVRK